MQSESIKEVIEYACSKGCSIQFTRGLLGDIEVRTSKGNVHMALNVRKMSGESLDSPNVLEVLIKHIKYCCTH